MQTLQDVIDATLAFPDQYGRAAFFYYDSHMRVIEAVCPIAREVLADLGKREGVFRLDRFR